MPTQHPTTCVEVQLSPEALATVKLAAEMQGCSVGDFVVSAAQDAARRAVEQAIVIQLSLEDQRAFLAAILDPPEPNTALRKAAATHKRMTGQA